MAFRLLHITYLFLIYILIQVCIQYKQTRQTHFSISFQKQSQSRCPEITQGTTYSNNKLIGMSKLKGIRNEFLVATYSLKPDKVPWIYFLCYCVNDINKGGISTFLPLLVKESILNIGNYRIAIKDYTPYRARIQSFLEGNIAIDSSTCKLERVLLIAIRDQHSWEWIYDQMEVRVHWVKNKMIYTEKDCWIIFLCRNMLCTRKSSFENKELASRILRRSFPNIDQLMYQSSKQEKKSPYYKNKLKILLAKDEKTLSQLFYDWQRILLLALKRKEPSQNLLYDKIEKHSIYQYQEWIQFLCLKYNDNKQGEIIMPITENYIKIKHPLKNRPNLPEIYEKRLQEIEAKDLNYENSFVSLVERHLILGLIKRKFYHKIRAQILAISSETTRTQLNRQKSNSEGQESSTKTTKTPQRRKRRVGDPSEEPKIPRAPQIAQPFDQTRSPRQPSNKMVSSLARLVPQKIVQAPRISQNPQPLQNAFFQQPTNSNQVKFQQARVWSTREQWLLYLIGKVYNFCDQRAFRILKNTTSKEMLTHFCKGYKRIIKQGDAKLAEFNSILNNVDAIQDFDQKKMIKLCLGTTNANKMGGCQKSVQTQGSQENTGVKMEIEEQIDEFLVYLCYLKGQLTQGRNDIIKIYFDNHKQDIIRRGSYKLQRYRQKGYSQTAKQSQFSGMKEEEDNQSYIDQ